MVQLFGQTSLGKQGWPRLKEHSDQGLHCSKFSLLLLDLCDTITFSVIANKLVWRKFLIYRLNSYFLYCQGPEELLELYNAVMQHMCNTVTSESLLISWNRGFHLFISKYLKAILPGSWEVDGTQQWYYITSLWFCNLWIIDNYLV